MKIQYIFTIIVLFLLFSFNAYSEPKEFRWGGKGFDPVKKPPYSSRYWARLETRTSPFVEVWVDNEVTADNRQISHIEILNQNGTLRIVSCPCSKAELHITAAVSCNLPRYRLLELENGIGTIKTFGSDGLKVLLEDSVDIEKLKTIAEMTR